MTSFLLTLTWIFVAVGTQITAGYDATVCTPSNSTVPIPESSAYLGQVWELEVEWKDDVKNCTYFIHDYADMPNKREKIVISSSFQSDVTIHYDWNTRDTIVEKTVVNSQRIGQNKCEFVKHRNNGRPYTYKDQFWMTFPQVLIDGFSASTDAVRLPSKMIRGVLAERWSACMHDYVTNRTVLATLYLSDRTWNFPHIDPNTQVPLRLEYIGRIHNGSQVTNINLVGDIFSFKRNDMVNNLKFSPDTFTTKEGLFCPTRTGTFEMMPAFPSSLSLVMEDIDEADQRVSYDELFYDSELRMVRYDYKLTRGGDPDSTTVIFDFQVGVKYIIDKHTRTCSSVTQLSLGDEFVANASLGMQTTAARFNADSSTTIQYVGKETVRGVLCNTWVGRYSDKQSGVQNIVQWYFTVSDWWEAVGSSAGGGAFFMMKKWAGGSNRPMVHNIIQYNPSNPDLDVFDFSPCFDQRSKKHFTIEFKVPSNCVPAYSQVSHSFVKSTVVRQLAVRLTIQPNRFTDVTFDLDKTNGRVFMSSTLLDRAVLTPYNKNEIDLYGAFSFLKGSITTHFTVNVTVPGPLQHVPLIGQSIVVHDLKQEFATTTSPKPPSTTILAPIVTPPKLTTRKTTPIPTPPPITPKPTKTTTTATSTTTTTTTSASTATTQRPRVTSRCPVQKPCPTSTAPATTKPCTCPKTSTASPCTGQRASSSSPNSGVTSGALAGGIVAAMVLGLVVGIIATRLYHIMKNTGNQMTINLIDENNI